MADTTRFLLSEDALPTHRVNLLSARADPAGGALPGGAPDDESAEGATLMAQPVRADVAELVSA